MKTITFFLVGNRTEKITEEQLNSLKSEVIGFFESIPNFVELYDENEVLYVEANKGEDLKYAFGVTQYDGNEDNGDGHTSCDFWKVFVTENNSEELAEYINNVGYEKQMGICGVEGYTIEGDELIQLEIFF